MAGRSQFEIRPTVRLLPSSIGAEVFITPMAQFRTRCWTGLGLVLLAAACFGQQAVPASDPGELVRRTVRNEIKAANDDNDHLLFHSTKSTPKGSITRIYVQTREATAGMTVAIDG